MKRYFPKTAPGKLLQLFPNHGLLGSGPLMLQAYWTYVALKIDHGAEEIRRD